jgi:hypothetical protein
MRDNCVGPARGGVEASGGWRPGPAVPEDAVARREHVPAVCDVTVADVFWAGKP